MHGKFLLDVKLSIHFKPRVPDLLLWLCLCFVHRGKGISLFQNQYSGNKTCLRGLLIHLCLAMNV